MLGCIFSMTAHRRRSVGGDEALQHEQLTSRRNLTFSLEVNLRSILAAFLHLRAEKFSKVYVGRFS
jgi:hypothetical protein